MAFAPSMGEGINVKISADTSGFTSRMRNAHKSIGSLKTALTATTVALGTLAVKGFADAVNKAREFEEAMIGVEKVTDPETAKEMQSAIMEMSETIPLAHEELARIAEQAGRLGIEGADNIRSFTETSAMMATATDMSVEEAGDSFARLTTLLELPIENVESLGSAINELANNMATSASEITDATMRSSSSLRQLGANEEEILALSASMNEVSISSRVAGTQLRTIADELMSPRRVVKLSEAFEMTNDEFRSMRDEDPVGLIKMLSETMGEGGDKAEELRDILGSTATQGLGALSSNLDSVDEAMGMANEQFKNSTSLQEEFATASRSVNNQMELIRNRMNSVYITIGNRFLPIIGDTMKQFQEMIPTSTQLEGHLDMIESLFEENSDTIEQLTSVFNFLVEFIQDTALSIFDILSSRVERVTNIFSDSFDRIDTGLEDNREGFETFRDIVMQVIDFVVEYVVDLWILQMEYAFNKWITIINVVNALLQGDFLGAVEYAFEGAMNVVNMSADFIEERLRGFEDFLAETMGIQVDLVGTFQTAMSTLRSVIETVTSRIRSVFNDRFSSVQDSTGNLSEAVGDFGEIVANVFNAVYEVIADNSDEIIEVLGFVVEFLADYIITGFENMLDVVTGVFEIIVNLLQGDFEGALDSARSTVRSVTRNMQEMFARQIGRINNLLGIDLMGTIQDTVEGIQHWFGESRLGQAIATARELFESLTDGVRGMWNSVVGNSYIPNMVNSISEWFGDTRLGQATAKAQELFGNVADGARDLWIRTTGNSYIPNMVEDIDDLMTGDLTDSLEEGKLQFNLLGDNIGDFSDKASIDFGEFTNAIVDNAFEITNTQLPNMASETKDTVDIMGVALDDFSRGELEDLVDSIETSKRMNEVWGDSFDEVEQTKRDVRMTIDNLIRQGIDPQSTAIQNLKDYYDDLAESQDDFRSDMDKLVDTMTDFFNGISDGSDTLSNLQDEFTGFLTETITGDIEDGMSLTESLSGVFDDIGGQISDLSSNLSKMAGSGGLGNILSAGAMGGAEGMMDDGTSTGGAVAQGIGAAIGAYFGVPALGAALGGAVGGIGEGLFGGDSGNATMNSVQNYQDALSDASSTLQDFGIDNFMPDLDWSDDTSGWRNFWGGSEINISNVDEVEDALDKFAEIAEELGIVFQEVSRGLESAFSEETFEGFIKSFTESIEKTLHDALLRQFMQEEATKGLMKDLTGEITMATRNGQITDSEMERIQRRYEAVISHSESFFNVLEALGGLQMPKLATGGVATAPTMAMIGEHEPEAVVPLSKWEQVVGDTSGSGSQYHNSETAVEVIITGNRFDDGYTTKKVGKDIVKELRRAGVS